MSEERTTARHSRIREYLPRDLTSARPMAGRSVDVPDLRDERFFMVRRGDVNTATEVIVVVNWLEELRERVR